jgi:hypothetical protein
VVWQGSVGDRRPYADQTAFPEGALKGTAVPESGIEFYENAHTMNLTRRLPSEMPIIERNLRCSDADLLARFALPKALRRPFVLLSLRSQNVTRREVNAIWYRLRDEF